MKMLTFVFVLLSVTCRGAIATVVNDTSETMRFTLDDFGMFVPAHGSLRVEFRSFQTDGIHQEVYQLDGGSGHADHYDSWGDLNAGPTWGPSDQTLLEQAQWYFRIGGTASDPILYPALFTVYGFSRDEMVEAFMYGFVAVSLWNVAGLALRLFKTLRGHSATGEV